MEDLGMDRPGAKNRKTADKVLLWDPCCQVSFLSLPEVSQREVRPRGR